MENLGSKRASRTVSACTYERDGGSSLNLFQNSFLNVLDGQPLLEEPPDSTSPAPHRPEPLSPIIEGKAMATAPAASTISKSRAGSSYHDRYPVPRTRKQTLTSITSEMTTGSRTNLNNQLLRVSARSYAQSLSRLSQAPQSIKAGESLMSIALSVRWV